MDLYTAKDFSIPKLEEISEKQIAEHLKLYQGYVKHTNRILAQIAAWQSEGDTYSYESHELWRRFGFEFGGMRNHEYYFGALEGGPQALAKDSALGKALDKQFGSFDAYRAMVKTVGGTRGSGWALTYYDTVAKHFHVGWVDEHHLGQLSTLQPILALDCWEHAYMVDYLPGERGVYMDAYLNSVNWGTVETWFTQITS